MCKIFTLLQREKTDLPLNVFTGKYTKLNVSNNKKKKKL